MFKNALVSCSNKTGLADFLTVLSARGMRIVSTGGTAQALRKCGLKVVDVSEQTGFQEVMDGRVKTLHPNIHMALLAREDNPDDLSTLKKFGVEPFDLVIGNLYPFEEEPSVDTIDIGGPSFLRSAAKSFSRIAVICDPNDYEWILKKGELNIQDRQKLAAKVFAHTSSYDSMIAKYYGGDDLLNFRDHSLGGQFIQSLRYGENPSQKAAWYRTLGEANGLHEAKILQGKELSYNNLLDIESAVSTVREFQKEFVCVAVKHNSPCGVSTHKDPVIALKLALAADPQSVFGGIIATNFKITGEMSEALVGIFLECVVAPEFSPEANEIFAKKKNVRLLEWSNFAKAGSQLQYRSISGGFLAQSRDLVAPQFDLKWSVHGEKLSEIIKADLMSAWRVCAHLKSNAIAIIENGQTLGLGMGQVNRVDAVEQAISRMRKFHPEAKSPVLASDAFFPFADSIEKISDAGIRYVIQPGGSVKDEEVMAKARELGVTIVITGQRHFLH